MSVASVLADLVAGGGLTGVISGAIGAFAKHKELKLQLEHRRYEMSYEIKMQREQNEADQALAEQDLLIEKERGADAAFRSAIEAEASLSRTNTSRWVNDIRALFRPFLTMVLWILSSVVWFSLPVTATATQMMMVQAVIQNASAATGFWFGSRAIKTTTP